DMRVVVCPHGTARSLVAPVTVVQVRIVTAHSVASSFIITAPTDIDTLSLHDALPIFNPPPLVVPMFIVTPSRKVQPEPITSRCRSEEHTSELQSHLNLVCRHLLEKKKRREQRLPYTRCYSLWRPPYVIHLCHQRFKPHDHTYDSSKRYTRYSMCTRCLSSASSSWY